MTTNVVIAGGGTAGHVYPGIALARAIQRCLPDAEISFVGTRRGIETTAVPAAGFRLHLIDVIGWNASLGAKRYLAPASVVRSYVQARRVLAAERADVVAGMGGYASLPVVLAARGSKIPVVIHEQNAVPGAANLIGARVTRNVALVFEEARRYFPSRAHIRVVGNPIRDVIADLDAAALRAEARASLGLKPDVPCVLVFGGSLGAARLNHAAMGLAKMWAGRNDRQMLVLTGRAGAGETTRRLGTSESMRVLEYLDRMEYAYAAADLIVARGGATTVAEISAVGIPSILVPYPYARRDHQTENARALAQGGGALVVADADATPDRLAPMIDAVLDRPERLTAMASAAKRFGKPHAARRFADWVLELTAETP